MWVAKFILIEISKAWTTQLNYSHTLHIFRPDPNSLNPLNVRWCSEYEETMTMMWDNVVGIFKLSLVTCDKWENMRMAKAMLNPNDHRTCYRDWVKFNEECSKECIRDKIHFCEHHIVDDTCSNTYFSSTLLIQNLLFMDIHRQIFCSPGTVLGSFSGDSDNNWPLH